MAGEFESNPGPEILREETDGKSTDGSLGHQGCEQRALVHQGRAWWYPGGSPRVDKYRTGHAERDEERLQRRHHKHRTKRWKTVQKVEQKGVESVKVFGIPKGRNEEDMEKRQE